ncbi:hypothetical protein ACFO4E_15380 [Nocardiopsis mangrovi]|uniref:Transcriptional regulator n=1 Tax=Nocardiopsis mangrovi TaxID=1179818 RepID=A0ABV9DWT3_9ACTN
MESIGVPWVAVVRDLGPPVVVLGVGAVLIALRRPRRAGLLWGALGLQVAAAALPYLWLVVQEATGLAGQTWVGLVMILVQPAVAALGWLLALAALLPPRRRERGAPDAPGGPAQRASASASAAAGG